MTWLGMRRCVYVRCLFFGAQFERAESCSWVIPADARGRKTKKAHYASLGSDVYNDVGVSSLTLVRDQQRS